MPILIISWDHIFLIAIDNEKLRVQSPNNAEHNILWEYSIKCINPVTTFEFISPKKIRNITGFERDSKTIGLISYNETIL